MGCGGTRHAGQGCAQFPRLAFQGIAQDQGGQAKPPRGSGGGFQRHGGGGDEAVIRRTKPGIAWLRAFFRPRRQMRLYGFRQLHPIMRHQGARIGETAWVRHGGARGNHTRVIPRHIGNRECHHARRIGGGGQPSAGKGGKMPADAVHFMDRSAGGQQRLIHRNQIIQCQARRGQCRQRRPPARDQKQHQIIRPRTARHFQQFCRRAGPRGIGYGVGCLQHAHPPRWVAMGIAGDNQAFDWGFGPGGLHRCGHDSGGFPRPQHNHPPAWAFRQMPRQHLARIGAGNGGVEHLAKGGAGGCIGKGHGVIPLSP